ncbi:MAG TPA: peptidoglycan-binding protein [Phycisphaerae bacterium]|nr:peptidoglycan-binding protein [Phycisphaerae bacterium]
MPTYTVKQGDHLSSIAHDAGFSGIDTIWNHPNNADLKTRRKNPNVLFPGDSLFIPDHQDKSVPGATRRRHRFRVKRPKLALRIVLEDNDETPLANLTCTLEVDNDSHSLTTSAAGLIEQKIEPDDKQARLLFPDPDLPFQREIPIKIGNLDPIDTPSGQVARLTNLGYFLGDPDKPDKMDVRSAVEEFQCNHTLPVDGKCGPATQAKLKEIHGC